jgi:hypothetical protein
MEVLDTSNFTLIAEDDDWEYNRSWGRLVEHALEKISKVIPNPVENVDYSTYFVIVEDDQEYEAYDLEWLKN